MTRQNSDRPTRSHTKWEEKQRYKELYDILREWLDLYDDKDKKGMDLFSFVLIRKYKSTQKFLRHNFADDPDIANNIKVLLNSWLLWPWIIEIAFVLCLIGFSIINNAYLKIYTGIMISRGGIGRSDVVYSIWGIILGLFYLLIILRRKEKLNKIVSVIKSISYTAFKKS